jgi:hypothetical protein
MLYAGTELEVGWIGFIGDVGDVGEVGDVGSEGRGSVPPERKEGQRERSSGRDVPVEEDGERWERIAAACIHMYVHT